MACCWQRGQGWCKTESIVHTDAEGKEYCLFHAPVGAKGKDKNTLSKKLTSLLFNVTTKKCDLSGIIIEDNLELENMKLPSINFFRAKFYGKINFFKTTFEASTTFEGAEFFEYISFFHASFKGEMNFTNATFHDRVIFNDASFYNLANYFETTFSKNASFIKTVFHKSADFTWAQFYGNADFLRASFKSYSDFYNSAFFKQCIFTEAEFADLVFFYNKLDEGNIFNDRTFFDKLRLKGNIIFDHVNLNKMTLLDTDLKKIDFITCNWVTEKKQKVLFDEKLLLVRDSKETQQAYLDRIERVESLYRQLKQKCKDEHDEREASNWHYREKEMKRKQGRLFGYNPFSLLVWYWLSSGYAERPIRAAIFLIGLFVVFALSLNLLTEFPDFDFKNQLLIISQYVTFEKEPLFKPELFWGHMHKLAAKIFIPLQAALMALAIRNRYRR